MNGRRPCATLRPENVGRLAGKSSKGNIAAGMFGEMPRERGFADAGITEQAKHLALALVQPAIHGFKRGVLFW